MPSLLDIDTRVDREIRRDPVERERPFRECAEQIEFSERRRDALAIADVRQQRLQQRVVEHALAGERAVLRGQRLVFEGFQLRRDVAFGVFQRLATPIVIGNLVRLAARDFDIKAMHLVVLDPQVRDARAGAFTRFEVDQELVAVLRDVAQFVEIGVVAARDHAAVANQRRRFGRNCARQQREAFGRRFERDIDTFERCRVHLYRRKPFAQLRQGGEGIAQAGEIAWPRRQQRKPPRNSFDIRNLPQRGAQAVETRACRRVEQRANCALPSLRDRRVARRMMQPVTQQTAAHGRAARIQQRAQRRRFRAAQGFGQFEIAPRGRVEADVLRLVLHLQAAHVPQLLALRGGCVQQQRARGAARAGQRVRAETVEAGDIELLAQPLRARIDIEMPRGRTRRCANVRHFERRVRFREASRPSAFPPGESARARRQVDRARLPQGATRRSPDSAMQGRRSSPRRGGCAPGKGRAG